MRPAGDQGREGFSLEKRDGHGMGWEWIVAEEMGRGIWSWIGRRRDEAMGW